MKKMNAKRRFMTLIEMMIVMFLIAMITGVIAYNYTGSLEEGKAFKTKAGINKIEQILSLETATGDIENVKDHWQEIIKRSPLVQNTDELFKDGWGNPYQVDVVEEDAGKVIKITSSKYDAHTNKKNKSSLFGKDNK